MSESVTINPDEPLNPGMDYVLLREEGIRLIQQMAGKIWTDYNESDPGVTTLEQLCYALTELSYRAEWPVRDLLIDKPDGKIDPHTQALFIPRKIFPCNPLTENDYRKLFVDRVPCVANAWLRCRPRKKSHGVNGLYDVFVYVPNLRQFPCPRHNDADRDGHEHHDGDDDHHHHHHHKRIREEVIACYSAHRNLCEDLYYKGAHHEHDDHKDDHDEHGHHRHDHHNVVPDVKILKLLTTVVSAQIAIDDTPSPESILAGLLFELSNFLAPQLRRGSLQDVLADGSPPDEIFNGPLLQHGFIDDAQLQPKMKSVSVDDIIAVMAASPGVRSVIDRNGEDGVVVRVDGKPYRPGESIHLHETEILDLIANAIHRLRLYCNGIEYKPNPRRVRRELEKLWNTYRTTYPLKAQYEEFFSFPQGEFRDVKRYFSIQNQFPNVYGIGEYGLPEGATKERRAQAKQFKGFLLVFEQLMADYFAQLANVKELYSIRPTTQTYFEQTLADSVPDVEPLLRHNYETGLRAIVARHDPVVERRNRFLDFLLALYAEQLDTSSVAGANSASDLREASGRRLIEAKQQLLDNLVDSTHDRARGFDYLGKDVDHNIAGMLIKSRIQLGMPVFARESCAELLGRLSLDLVTDEASGIVPGDDADYIEQHFDSIVPLATDVELSADQLQSHAERLPLPSKGGLPEGWLWAGGNIEHFRVGTLPDDRLVAVCKRPADLEWHIIGEFTDHHRAAEAVHAVVEVVSLLHRHARQLYIVEHTLLRPRRTHPHKSDEPETSKERFVYSFTISAVVLARSCQSDYARFVMEVLRQNTPSHIVIDLCCVSGCQMRDFEHRYDHWRTALRRGNARQIDETSARLRRFLRRHAPKQPNDSPGTSNGDEPPEHPSDPPSVRSSLVLYLPFDGDIENHSARRFETSARGSYSATYAQGVRVGAQSKVVAAREEISVADVGPLTDEFTLEFWLNVEETKRASAARTIASLGDTVVLGVNTDSWKLHVTLDPDAPPILGGNIKPAQWHHVAVVYRGKEGQICLYLDGEEVVRKGAKGHRPFAAGEVFQVGSRRRGFAGMICDLRLYDTAFGHDLVRTRAKPPNA